MRFSTGILASALLFSAVYAQESSSAPIQEGVSVSFSAESVAYEMLEKRDIFDFFKNLFFGPDHASSSSSSGGVEALPTPFAPIPSVPHPSVPVPSLPVPSPPIPSASHTPPPHGKRDGNMQEVLESLANFYYASASLESAAMSMAREEWSSNPEEVASVIVEASRQHKQRYMKRDENSVSEEESISEFSVADASSIFHEDAFAPVSQAYLPVYYRRAKRHLELRDEVEDDETSISEVPDQEPSAYAHSHHHHEESVSNYHYEEQASAEYFEAASGLMKREVINADSFIPSIEDESSSVDSIESSLEDVASKIAQDVQDQIDRALGKTKPIQPEDEPLFEPALLEQEQEEFWIADAQAEDQFKGYDWTGSN